MTGRKRKGLSAEDHAVWQKVARSTEPLRANDNSSPSRQPSPTGEATIPDPEKPRKIAARLPRSTRGHQVSLDLPPGAGKTVSDGRTSMDRRRYNQLRRGKLSPQARIDLHGMTAARAHPELANFIADAHARGLRLVLVITGKGNTRRDEESIMPVRRGVLRHSVPQWLTRTPLAPLILQVTPAHARHGGGGAIYVYLRRSRG